MLVAGIAAADTGPVRLLDQRRGAPGAPPLGRTIDATWRRIVLANPARFTLPEMPERPRLRFAIGLDPVPPGSSVRFEVFLEKDDAPPVGLYRAELDGARWQEEEIDLGPHDLKGGRLLFLKTLVKGEKAALSGAVFAEPMVIPGGPRPGTSVILISIDTLRADRVGAYGYATARTPALDALAAKSIWYANAYSASTWTYPSHASLLSGVYPAAFPDVDKPESLPAPVPSPPNVASVFREAGYLTAGFTGGGFMSARWGFAIGFDSLYQFEQPTASTERCAPGRFDGAEVFGRATKWMRVNAAHPFFLFLHTYDAHDRCPVWPPGVSPLSQLPDPGPARRKEFSDYYDERIAAADRLLGGFVDALKALGLFDNVVLVVTSDHGDAFWEHGFFGHGCPLTPFEELIQVPLIVHAPGHGTRHGRIEQPVSAVDVAPTLLALAGLTPPTTMQGHGLPGLGIPSRPESAPIFVHCGGHLAVRIGSHKLIANREAASATLYDLAEDPDEKQSGRGGSPEVLERLRRHAAEYWVRGASGAGSSEHVLDGVDEPTRERLRALGYAQ
jgi:arylsulfatase A-like enzyme